MFGSFSGTWRLVDRLGGDDEIRQRSIQLQHSKIRDRIVIRRREDDLHKQNTYYNGYIFWTK